MKYYQKFKYICCNCDKHYTSRYFKVNKGKGEGKTIKDFVMITELSHGLCNDCIPEIYRKNGLEKLLKSS